MYDVVIIDPASTEFNRGSFCYLPYILYNCCRETGLSVHFEEDFTVANIDKLPPAREYLVALWSYPQIEGALVLDRYLPHRPSFFGYYPLIESLHLPVKKLSEFIIAQGMTSYPKYYHKFKTILLSDCDMHLKKYEGTVYPLFTSYGCPRGCAFCPSTVNCDKKRVVPDLFEVLNCLTLCAREGYTNIHFTDEDFFFDTKRAHVILKHIAGLQYDFNLIALGSVSKVLSFIRSYGQKPMHDAGLRLIEVGFETGDDQLAQDMGKAPVRLCEELAQKCTVPIFWLTLTFFPGETIKTLNTTGEFLREHGFSPDELYGRIRTNGTEGGLGQFFQAYHGTEGFNKLRSLGKVLTERPMRLMPSFIPNSFLNSIVLETGVPTTNEMLWYEINNVPCLVPKKGITIKENILREVRCDTTLSFGRAAVSYATAARLGKIR